MKCFKGSLLVAFVLILAAVCASFYLQAGRSNTNTIYQVSTGNALIAGLFEGAVDFKTLARHGDFGLGSVDGMDGELIAIDGKFYRIAQMVV